MPAGQKDRDFNEALGLRVRYARVAAGLSQTTLGERLGVSFQQVQKYEKGSNRISVETLVRVAAILGRPVADLLDDDQRVAPISTTAIRDAVQIDDNLARLSPKLRRRVVALLDSLVGHEGDAAQAEAA